MSNAAQTAALAAFNKDSSRSDSINSSKPKLHLNTAKSPRQNHNSVKSLEFVSPIHTPQIRKASGDSLMIDYTPSSVISDDYFTDRAAYSPQEMINNVKQSIGLKSLQQDPSLKRLSSDYSPQEMLKNLKNSLHQKALNTERKSISNLNLNDSQICYETSDHDDEMSRIPMKRSNSEKPKRKPPPGLESAPTLKEKMQLNAKSSDTFSSGGSVILSEEEDEFPQFPNLQDKKKKSTKGVYYHSDENLQPQKTTTSSYQQQQTVQFRTTMRKDTRKDRKSMFDEYKPWKSHNDLNYLTDSEKKRYEGVWVSNRGTYMNLIITRLTGVNYDLKQEEEEDNKQQMDDSLKAALLSEQDTDDLHNLKKVEINQLILGSIVKRIWKRSKLPNDTLEQIWNLVDFRKDGTLNKNEFLVGMWLVDQCLYGRKLPKKVDNIVWDNLGGIGVHIKKR
ncbi:unnamed protein product [Candida verbasci]|uniref:Increased rDNA silencing protein 4 n=1 Tax=Candida verbasci TaxID=1227364 RepID=A0A9W4TYU3_9ASCO|nr:unnamed protein product [Candida verbasci]